MIHSNGESLKVKNEKDFGNIRGGCPKGNTRQLVDSFMQGSMDAGHVVEFISLNMIEIKGCIGCNDCRYGKLCVQKGGFNELVPKIKKANLIVFASPLLF